MIKSVFGLQMGFLKSKNEKNKLCKYTHEWVCAHVQSEHLNQKNPKRF